MLVSMLYVPLYLCSSGNSGRFTSTLMVGQQFGGMAFS